MARVTRALQEQIVCGVRVIGMTAGVKMQDVLVKMEEIVNGS